MSIQSRMIKVSQMKGYNEEVKLAFKDKESCYIEEVALYSEEDTEWLHKRQSIGFNCFRLY